MVRKDNWPILFSEYLKERMKMPFEWGKNDCMNFVAKGVEAITGCDFFATYDGYSTEEEAKVFIDEKGGIVAMISEHLGPGHRNPLLAHRGDVVIVKRPEITGGLVDDSGSKIAVVSEQGLIRLPLSSAWRIWSY